jgi:hypothetical protein
MIKFIKKANSDRKTMRQFLRSLPNSNQMPKEVVRYFRETYARVQLQLPIIPMVDKKKKLPVMPVVVKKKKLLKTEKRAANRDRVSSGECASDYITMKQEPQSIRATSGGLPGLGKKR